MSENHWSDGMPRISVVIAAFNAEPFIDRAIASVLRQDFEDWELILVDDGSSDGTLNIMQAHATANSRIRVIHQENKGQVAALARGFSAANGEYFLQIDADDYLAADCLGLLYSDALTHDADAVVCHPLVQREVDGDFYSFYESHGLK